MAGELPMTVGTPRPAPQLQFFQQAQTFSTKKERHGTPIDKLPPKPPVKSAPPISRIFPNKPLLKAQAVSFRGNDSSFYSPHYNIGSKDLYFNQCFEIDSKIGVGSFGEVYKVRGKEDGKYYAVKKSRDRFRGESDRKRKLEEVAKHEKLPKHPNCVGFVKAWEERNFLYIQTELCRTCLSDISYQNHDIAEQLIWNYVVDLLMAVKHLHDHDLAHMDIKPENVFISDNEICKLGDFGLVIDLAKNFDNSDAQEGDPKYLAPELMQGKFGKPADIFSLGITILELAGDLDLPRGGELWHQLRSGHLPEEFLSGVSDELKEVIRWMMEPDPVRRPTVDELLAKPNLSKIWKIRRRQQVIQNVVSTVNSMFQGVLSFFVALWLTFTYPVKAIVPSRLETPTKDGGVQLPPEYDYSFSDDDVLDDEGISIHNNSVGMPLDYSTSSEESAKDFEFLIPSVPSRKAQTTPGYRQRPPRTYFSHGSSSPILSSSSNGSVSIYSSSPIRTSSISRGYKLNESITPNSSFHESMIDQLEEELAPIKTSIEPKNLLGAFESASSEMSDED